MAMGQSQAMPKVIDGYRGTATLYGSQRRANSSSDPDSTKITGETMDPPMIDVSHRVPLYASDELRANLYDLVFVNKWLSTKKPFEPGNVADEELAKAIATEAVRSNRNAGERDPQDVKLENSTRSFWKEVFDDVFKGNAQSQELAEKIKDLCIRLAMAKPTAFKEFKECEANNAIGLLPRSLRTDMLMGAWDVLGHLWMTDLMEKDTVDRPKNAYEVTSSAANSNWKRVGVFCGGKMNWTPFEPNNDKDQELSKAVASMVPDSALAANYQELYNSMWPESGSSEDSDVNKAAKELSFRMALTNPSAFGDSCIETSNGTYLVPSRATHQWMGAHLVFGSVWADEEWTACIEKRNNPEEKQQGGATAGAAIDVERSSSPVLDELSYASISPLSNEEKSLEAFPLRFEVGSVSSPPPGMKPLAPADGLKDITGANVLVGMKKDKSIPELAVPISPKCTKEICSMLEKSEGFISVPNVEPKELFTTVLGKVKSIDMDSTPFDPTNEADVELSQGFQKALRSAGSDYQDKIFTVWERCINAHDQLNDSHKLAVKLARLILPSFVAVSLSIQPRKRRG
ncbi:unknown protein [Seminavis robusta]|uniref:Uncharacterized protein n=1 Tax=Seminavis robusta TaxID=568900 RepID=A0A9N8DGP0_9STRA|nr:unknown protein [Seminavis robusta]|eukprot:Sro149_g068610.1 n/a (573) ;mRNA; r:78626-80344